MIHNDINFFTNVSGDLKMNEAIVLSMASPYVKDGSITYEEFDNIYSMLSMKEKYGVVEILYRNGINLIDANERIDADEFVLDAELDSENENFDILYDESIFKDNEVSDESDVLLVNQNIRQSNSILCSLIQEGNKQAEQDLCVKNKRLVDKYVNMYQKKYGNRLDFEDLEQVGFIGLIKAAQRFDFKQGTTFSTYAVWWIKQSISREIMDNGYAIRIPVHMMERINKVVRMDNLYIEQGMRKQERWEAISEELGIAVEDIRECLILKNNYLSYISLNTPVGEDETTEIGEFVPQEEVESVEDVITDRELRETLEHVISTLRPREQEILRLRFGLDDDHARTLGEIGEKFGLTRERIRQIEVKALRKLRHPSRSRKLTEFL
jgi:RNA polymerase primary sigma factor